MPEKNSEVLGPNNLGVDISRIDETNSTTDWTPRPLSEKARQALQERLARLEKLRAEYPSDPARSGNDIIIVD